MVLPRTALHRSSCCYVASHTRLHAVVETILMAPVVHRHNCIKGPKIMGCIDPVGKLHPTLGLVANAVTRIP